MSRQQVLYGWMIHPAVMNTRKIALIVALVALCVASNYAMISIYNVKFMDLIVFVAGFAFGPFVGATVGVSYG